MIPTPTACKLAHGSIMAVPGILWTLWGSTIGAKAFNKQQQSFAKGQVDRTKKNYHYFDMLQQQSNTAKIIAT